MALRDDFLRLSHAARPNILKLARRQKLIDTCFKEFQRKVYPNAPQDQVADMRTCFFAGAAELSAMLMYGSSIAPDVTNTDMQFMSDVTAEMETFYKRVIETADANEKGTKH